MGSVTAGCLKLSICKWSASRLGRFIRRNIVLNAYWMGGLMDPGTGLDPVVAMTNIAVPAGIQILVIQLVASQYTGLATPASFTTEK